MNQKYIIRLLVLFQFVLISCENAANSQDSSSDGGRDNNSAITIHDGNKVASLVIEQSIFDSLNTNGSSTIASVQQIQSITQEVYQKFNDVFDFVILVMNNSSLPSRGVYGEYLGVKNTVTGLGRSTFDSSSSYSADSGVLRGVILLYDAITFTESSSAVRTSLANGPVIHEILHHWANFTDASSPFYGGGHWGSTGVEGKFDRVANTFSPLELYFMGLIGNTTQSATEWNAGFTYKPWSTSSSVQVTDATKTGKTLMISDGTSLVRNPSYTTSQKSFRALVLVLTTSQLDESIILGAPDGSGGRYSGLNDDVDWITTTSPDNSKYYRTFNNFYTDTQQKATLQMNALDGAVR